MSTHYEEISAKHARVEYGPLEDDQQRDDPFKIEGDVLTISEDDVYVIKGTPLELRRLAERILDALPGGSFKRGHRYEKDPEAAHVCLICGRFQGSAIHDRQFWGKP